MDNRLAAVWISFELLQEIITVGWQGCAECIEGVPAHARLIRSYTDEVQGVGVLVFAHESFAEVPSGEEIPTLRVVHRRAARGAPKGGAEHGAA